MARRVKPAEERRRDLLDAGLALFAEQGVAATSVEDVTRRAGVAKGTFYLYFATKEALLLALRQRFEADLVDRIDAAVAAAGPDWGARLDAWVGACFADFRAQAARHDLLFHPTVAATLAAAATAPEPPEPADPPALDRSLRRLITAGVRAGVYAAEDPDLTGTLLCHALHGAFHGAWPGPGAPDPERLIAAGRTLLRRALLPGTAATPPNGGA